jgi:hypothetical protein
MKYLKDILVTDTFLLRGHVNSGGQRLSTLLNTTPKRHVEMEEVTLFARERPGTTLIGRMLVRVEEILLAYEMDESGDKAMKILAERDRDEVPVTIYFGGAAPIQIDGKASRRVVDRAVAGAPDFLVLLEPAISGMAGMTADEGEFSSLPYVIVNRARSAGIAIRAPSPESG